MKHFQPYSNRLHQVPTISCREAQKLMSPFIDSMTTPVEAERLEGHSATCEPCQRQLQSYISVRSLLRAALDPPVPPDLALETRIRLSHARSSGRLDGLATRLENVLKPIAVPAILGFSFTVLMFGALFSGLPARGVVAPVPGPTSPIAFYRPVRTTDPTLNRLAGQNPNLAEPLTVDIVVSGTGRMIDYTVLSGPGDPIVDVWLKDLLYYAEFTPASLLGRPVRSRIILSFIGVTS